MGQFIELISLNMVKRERKNYYKNLMNFHIGCLNFNVKISILLELRIDEVMY